MILASTKPCIHEYNKQIGEWFLKIQSIVLNGKKKAFLRFEDKKTAVFQTPWEEVKYVQPKETVYKGGVTGPESSKIAGK